MQFFLIGVICLNYVIGYEAQSLNHEHLNDNYRHHYLQHNALVSAARKILTENLQQSPQRYENQLDRGSSGQIMNPVQNQAYPRLDPSSQSSVNSQRLVQPTSPKHTSTSLESRTENVYQSRYNEAVTVAPESYKTSIDDQPSNMYADQIPQRYGNRVSNAIQSQTQAYPRIEPSPQPVITQATSASYTENLHQPQYKRVVTAPESYQSNIIGQPLRVSNRYAQQTSQHNENQFKRASLVQPIPAKTQQAYRRLEKGTQASRSENRDNLGSSVPSNIDGRRLRVSNPPRDNSSPQRPAHPPHNRYVTAPTRSPLSADGIGTEPPFVWLPGYPEQQNQLDADKPTICGIDPNKSEDNKRTNKIIESKTTKATVPPAIDNSQSTNRPNDYNSDLPAYINKSEQLAKLQLQNVHGDGSPINGSAVIETEADRILAFSNQNKMKNPDSNSRNILTESRTSITNYSSDTEYDHTGTIKKHESLSTGESEYHNRNGHQAGFKAATTSLNDNGKVSTYSIHTPAQSTSPINMSASSHSHSENTYQSNHNQVNSAPASSQSTNDIDSSNYYNSGLPDYISESERLAKLQLSGDGGSPISGSAVIETEADRNLAISNQNQMKKQGSNNGNIITESQARIINYLSDTEFDHTGKMKNYESFSTGESEHHNRNGYQAGYKAATATLNDNGNVSRFSIRTQ